MAVKKHELLDNRNQLDLSALAQYIQLMNEQPNYLPSPNELVKHCQDIVKCLARASGSEEQLWDIVQSLEDFLVRVVNTVHLDLRQEVVTAILDKFYSLISDPQSDACPATSVVLVVLDASDTEATLSAARWLVQQGENGPAGAGLRASLTCLYRWMCEWHSTPALGNWISAFIQALEENDQYEVLIEVSMDNLAQMFLAMESSAGLRQSVANVIFHVLASLRESTEALDRISPHVGRILMSLAADSGQWSRQVLQNVVDILNTMVDCLIASFDGEAQDMFKDKYADVISCLERHMASGSCQFLQLPPWRARDLCLPTATAHAPMRKVGLLNLGNTCYMNSVMQALLVTRQFSNHVVMRMNAVPYWSKMGIMFAKMIHSITTKLNPDEFFGMVKPPFFIRDNQHDSSEFLGYLFELLQSYEHSSERNFDYSRPVALTGGRGRITQSPLRLQGAGSPSSASASCSASVLPPIENDPEVSSRISPRVSPRASPNRRSVSPRPSSSAAGSSSSGKRAIEQNDSHLPPKKRFRPNESYLRRDSFIDSMFGGVLMTRVECTECHSSSLSRDVFRDLQLAFPEKEDCQHSVQSLLEFYCSKERLSGDNQYECGDCGGLRDAERSVLIETTPKYLILVLKHFKFEPKLQVQLKLMHSIYHNHTVTLPTVRSQADHAAYTLYAAVIHDGTTLDSGHYYTLAKDKDQWHMYNDDVVSVADESQLNGLNRSSTPYILFYKRTDIEEGTAPSLEELPPKLQELVLAHNKHYVDTVRKMCLTRP